MCFRVLIVCAALGGLTTVGCSQQAAPQPSAAPQTETKPVAVAVAPALDPKEVFTTRCATCHGVTGHGDGPASGALNPKPRNYTDGAWQKSVTDDQIKKTILYGGAAVGKS